MKIKDDIIFPGIVLLVAMCLIAIMTSCASQTTQPTSQPSIPSQVSQDLAFAQQVANDAAIVIPFLPVADQPIANAALKLVTDGLANAQAAINSGASPTVIGAAIAQLVSDAKALQVNPLVVQAKAAVVKAATPTTLPK